MIRNCFNPDLYHGENKSRNFFEGWYFKIVDPFINNVYSFIPGVFIGKDGGCTHSFIQILKGREIEYKYMKFPLKEFTFSRKSFILSINKNLFSKTGICLNIDKDNIKISGELRFKDLKQWPSNILNPGSMGFYNYIPKMQCYSQVCAMDLKLEGSLNIDGKEIDFTGGRGYIEKNWGNSFPYSWIWVQCNNFKSSNVSLTCSIGHIPFLNRSFRGFLIGLFIDSTFYKFTTTNKSILDISLRDTSVLIRTENKNYILIIETFSNVHDFMTCYGPRGNEMTALVDETLRGEIKVELVEKVSNKTIMKDYGSCTGIEYGGKQKMILNNY